MAKDPNIVKIPCRGCGQPTNHSLEWEQIDPWSTEDGIRGKNTFSVLSCLGCNEITFKTTSENSEDLITFIDNDGKPCYEYDQKIKFFPDRGRHLIQPKNDNFHFPSKVRAIYLETIEAFNQKNRILCAMGVRAVIEAICQEEKIIGSNLQDKINQLKSEGVISSNYLSDGLHQARLLGNDSAHDLTTFSDYELKAAIGLVESLLENHYLLTEKIDILKKRRTQKK